MTAWSDVCRECVNVVAEVPIEILLVSVLATLLGLFVLVSTIPLLGLNPDRTSRLQRPANH